MPSDPIWVLIDVLDFDSYGFVWIYLDLLCYALIIGGLRMPCPVPPCLSLAVRLGFSLDSYGSLSTPIHFYGHGLLC